MIRFPCPQCGKRLKAQDDYAGKHVKCNRCGLSQLVPGQPVSVVKTQAVSAGAENHAPAGAATMTLATPAPAVPKAKRPAGGSFILAVYARRWLVGGIGGLVLLVVVGLVVFLLIPSELDRKLADLKSNDPNVSQPALEWLAEATPVDTQRAKVTGALEPILSAGDPHGNLDPDMVLRVYLNWANADNVPDMTRMVQTPTMAKWNGKKTALVMDKLGKLQDERGADALAAKLGDPKLHDQAINALSVLGPKAEPAVLDYLFDPDPDVRARADQLLAGYGTKPSKIRAAALDRLQSKNADTQRSAVVWFVDNGPDSDAQKADASPRLTKLLDNLSPELCNQVLQALKQWATKDCLPQLLAYAQRERKNTSGNLLLIDVLAPFKDERAAEAIALQLPNAHARDKASAALLNLGNVADKAVLEYINHPDEAVRKKALSLCRDLKISDDRQLEQTLTDIADTRPSRSRTALQHLATLRPSQTNQARVAKLLNAALLDHDAGIRDAALSAVKVWGTTDNTAALVKLLGDCQAEDVGPDARLTDILGSLKDAKAAPVLAQGLTHANERAAVSRALTAIGPGAEEAVIPFLQVFDRDARFAAVHILAEIGTAKSVPALTQVRDAYGGAGDGAFYNEAQLAIQKISARK